MHTGGVTGARSQVQGRVDIVLFEGWMLGFRPLPADQAVSIDPDLGPVNELLKEYEAAWDSHVDVWLVIRVPDPSCVYKCVLYLLRSSSLKTCTLPEPR